MALEFKLEQKQRFIGIMVREKRGDAETPWYWAGQIDKNGNGEIEFHACRWCTPINGDKLIIGRDR